MLTDKLVKAKVKGYPWWPAHICTPLDAVVADALEGSSYTLISSVGNEGMFMVNDKDVVDFSEETDEDLSQYDKSTLEDLHDVRFIDASRSIGFCDLTLTHAFSYYFPEHGDCKKALA